MQVPSFPFSMRHVFDVLLIICTLAFLIGCTSKAVTEKPAIIPEKPKPPTAVPMWLGNAERTFYGTGPWKDGELKIDMADDVVGPSCVTHAGECLNQRVATALESVVGK